jgi:serine/threonine-protein kinase HipA
MTDAPNRSALVYVGGRLAGRLVEGPGNAYRFTYEAGYDGPPVSLTMPVAGALYEFDRFPPFFDGLLPEGWQLEALLREAKLDRRDYMGQLLAVGRDMVGAVTVEPVAGTPK